MKTNIKATGIELSPALRAYVEDKLSHLERLLNPNDESLIANVEIGKTTQHHHHGEVYRAEVNLHAFGHQFRAAADEVDLYAAIDKMKDEIIEEVKTQRGKHNALLRRGGRQLKGMLRSLNPWKK